MSKFLSLFVLLMLAGSALADELPKLTLEGHATLYKPADQMSFTIGVTTLGKEANNVLSENSQKMLNVIEALEKNGLLKTEYRTGQFTIQPTYTPYPKNPPPDWKQSINGYEVTHTILIKTDKIKQVGKFIDAASQAGANKIDDIRASLKDEQAYRSEAITLATKNAINDAKVMAEAAQVQLLRLLSLSLNESHVNPLRPLTPMMFKASAAESTTPIEAGEIEIKANVTIVYEIGKS